MISSMTFDPRLYFPFVPILISSWVYAKAECGG